MLKKITYNGEQIKSILFHERIYFMIPRRCSCGLWGIFSA